MTNRRSIRGDLPAHKRLTWCIWSPSREPKASLRWIDGDPRVVVVGEDIYAPGYKLDDPILRIGHAFVVPTRHPEAQARRTRTYGCRPNHIPALIVERQADLLPASVEALVTTRSHMRALLVMPREAIDLWHILHEEACPLQPAPIDVVIVRGTVGPNAWPIHPDWVRSLRAQCEAAEVTFVFLGWGDWCPAAAPRADIADQDRVVMDRVGPPQPATWADVLGAYGSLWGFERLGAERSGCLLDGVEYLSLPELEAESVREGSGG